jgi:hypothetical protein
MPEYEVFHVAFEATLETPAQFAGINSPWSVEDINAGKVAWLASPSWASVSVVIPAGTTYAAFKKLVKAAGGSVYEPVR